MASAQLGSFRYDMILDFAKFDDALTKAQRRTEQGMAGIQRTIQHSVDSVGDGLKDIAGKIAGAFALEKLAEAGKQAIEFADSLGKASQKVGVSVEAMSALNVQAKLSNVALDQLQGGMEKLAKNAAAAAAGNKQAAADFSAIGVSVKDANGNLRPMQELLGDVAKKFSTYADSAQKTADAQAIFGKSGAELIPVLNELGENGLAKVTEQAREFGQVISTETAKQAEVFNDNLTKLGLEAKGFANSVVAQLLPALDDLSSSWVEAGKTADSYSSSSTVVANGLKYLVLALVVVKETFVAVGSTIGNFFGAIRETFSAAGDIVQVWATDTRKALTAAFHFDKAGIDAANADFKSQVDAIGKRFEGAASGLKESVGSDWAKAFSAATAATDSLFNGLDKTAKGADATAESTRNARAPLIALGDAADKTGAQALAAAQAMDALQKLVTGIEGKAGDQFAAAQATFTNQILALKDAAEAAAIAGGDVDTIIEKWQRGETAAAAALAKTNAQLEKQSDLLGNFERDLADQTALIGLSDRALAVAQAVKKVTEEYQRNVDEGKAVKGSLQEIQAGAAAAAGKFYDLSQKAKLNADAAHDWQAIWSNAGNSIAATFSKVLVEGGSLFQGLKDLAKQTVEAIIQYFVKLAVINPILNSIFGSGAGMGAGFSILPTMANTAFGGGNSSIINAAVGNGGASNVIGSGGATGSTGGATSLFSPSSWIDAGKNLYQGFTSLFGGGVPTGFAAGAGGSGAFAGSVAQGYTGVPAFAGSQASAGIGGLSYGGYGSAIGQGLGVAGGIYAGYNEFKAAGGGVAGLAGGAAYGVGTYFAGAGVSAALAGGLSAGLAAIPVVGWIAIAAMLIDKFSGGKLFGTAWSTKGSTTSFNLGPNGGNATAFLSQTKQGALFSGTKYRDKTVDAGKDAQDAAQQLFDSVEKIMVQAAHQIQSTVPPMIAAALQIVNTYDKKGKVTSTKYMVDILGKKYEEASQELAATRISAEAIVATVAASEAGKAASTIAERWRGSADTLMEGAQFLVSATADISRGINLLGDGGTLTQITDIVGELQQGGEKLQDTYSRLGQESKVMTDALELTGVNIGKTGADFVRFADDVANAAGGVQALAQMISTFNQAYFSPAELAAQNQAALKKASDSALTKIGENPLESMAQFKADFLAALPSLTPEQLEQWYAAGVALANYTKSVSDSANALLSAKSQYAQFELQQYGDEFVSSIASIVAAEQNQIATANQLAIAAGLAGASQSDLARITAQGSIAMGQALGKLTQGIQSDVAILKGNLGGGDGPGYINVVGNNKAAVIAAQNATKAQQSAAAYDVIEKLGNYIFASGKSASDIYKQFGITPEELARTLGTSADDVAKQIQSATDQAAALTNMAAQGDVANGLLQDILAAIQGTALPYDISRLGAIPTTPLASPGKLGGGPNQVNAPPAGKEMAQAVSDGNKASVSEQKRTNDLLEKIHKIFEGRGISVNRNTAGGRPIYVGVN